MNIRPASIADIKQCEGCDCSYATQFIWQMDEEVASDSIGVTFRRLRIPRSMEARYPLETTDLFEVWRRRECFLVAEEAGTVYGYLDMVVHRPTWQGQIKHLVVHRPYRRRGVATLLLEGSERWARGSELSAIATVVQSKNDPAMRFLIKRGYTFHGFVDHYFSNGEMGLFYSLDL